MMFELNENIVNFLYSRKKNRGKTSFVQFIFENIFYLMLFGKVTTTATTVSNYIEWLILPQLLDW